MTASQISGGRHGIDRGAAPAAENGATAHELTLIFAWKTLVQAELYTETVRQRLRANGAIGLMRFAGQTWA
jgi:hypothetical protein